MTLTAGTTSQTSTLAIASLAMSCASIVLGPFGFVPGVVLGALALKELRQHPELSGKGIALAGVLVGCLLGVLFVVAALLLLLTRPPAEPFIYELQ